MSVTTVIVERANGAVEHPTFVEDPHWPGAVILQEDVTLSAGDTIRIVTEVETR